MNGGSCIEDGTEFTCVCSEGYGGPTCSRVIVHFRPIPPVTDGLSFPITLNTEVDGFSHSVGVSIKLPNEPRPRVAVVHIDGGQQRMISVDGKVGVVRVTLPEDTKEVVYEPRERNVFISGDSGSETSYFEQFNLTKGLLQPSCCSPDDVILSCPGDSTQTISLLAPCQWGTTNSKVTRTVGAVFAQSSSLSLPTSLSGLRYRDTRGRNYINDIRVSPSQCQLCDECRDDTDGVCYCYTHTPQHTQEFLQARALAYTYITQIQHLLPSWMEILVDLDMSLESSASSKNDLFAPITLSSEPVSSFEGCSKLTNLVGSRYSVMRYDKTLSAVIDGQRYDYRENTETGTTGDVMCFAVDLCHESESPVHMQISQPINDILVSQYLRHFTSGRQWNILLHTVSLYRQPVTQSSTATFWNGMEMVSQPDLKADVSVNTELELEFNDVDLNLRIDVSGTVSFDYRVSAFYIHIYYLSLTSCIIGKTRNTKWPDKFAVYKHHQWS